MRKKTAVRKPAQAVKPMTGMRGLSKIAPGQDVEKMTSAIKDILGVTPTEITLQFPKKLSPGGIRAGDGSWDGNVYKYRY